MYEIQFLASGGDFLYANGTGVGDFINPSGAFGSAALAFDDINIATHVAHVPEPGTLALFGAGLLALYAGRRRAA